MKISNSKKELARIISENGGWPEGAEWSAQDGNRYGRSVGFFKKSRPKYGNGSWFGGVFLGHHVIRKAEKINSPHQTILSRDEYFHLYPAPDADGWIEWKGGECPVGEGDRIDVKFSDGDELFDVSSDWGWDVDAGGCNIIAYRLHKPEQANPEFCESVTRSIPEPELKPTIEQLAADYRNAKDYAERKQREADDAKADVGAKLKALKLAGEALGLLVSPITASHEPEPVITDWRDLRVGDVIEVTGSSNEGWQGVEGKELTIKIVRSDGASTGEWLVRDNTEFRIIRRP